MTGLVPPTPGVLRAYRLSTYAAGGIVAHVGRRPSGLSARWSGRPLAMLSACNPGGRRLPDGRNRRMMACLRQTLRRLDWAEGEGRLGHWSEPLLVVAVTPSRALVLARRFRQNAVILLRDDHPARLVLLTLAPCAGASAARA